METELEWTGGFGSGGGGLRSHPIALSTRIHDDNAVMNSPTQMMLGGLIRLCTLWLRISLGPLGELRAVLVQGGDLMHIVSVQLEIEDGQVFAAMFWVRRTRDGDDPSLVVPA